MSAIDPQSKESYIIAYIGLLAQSHKLALDFEALWDVNINMCSQGVTSTWYMDV